VPHYRLDRPTRVRLEFRQAEPPGNVVAACAPIVAGMTEDDKTIGRSRRQLNAQTSIPAAVARPRAKNLMAGHFAAERAGDLAQ
jgi:hypothetical protein